MEANASRAAHVIIAIIPIVGIVMGSAVAFFYLLWNHKRNILLIQSGHYSRPKFNLLSFCLLTGLLLVCVGITLTVFLAVFRGVDFALLGGVIPLSLGIGLLAYYGMKRSDKSS